MKCPNCGSENVFICTNALEYPHKRYFECIDCFHQSRKVPIYNFRCINHKSEWEIELDKLKQEWQ